MKGLEPVADQQAVVFGLGAIGGCHHAFDTVYLGHLLAGVAARCVFLHTSSSELSTISSERLLTGEHRATAGCGCSRVRLGAEDGDVVQVGCDLAAALQWSRTPAMPLPIMTSFCFCRTSCPWCSHCGVENRRFGLAGP